MVDLVGFEPTTSSRPFKKYQSLTDTSARNKRLRKRPHGRRWTPRGTFWASGLHADSRNSTSGTGTRRAFPRAVAGCSHCCLPKETTIGFHIRTMPMWEVEAASAESIREGTKQLCGPAVQFPYCTTAGCFAPTLANRSWISRVSSSWRVSWIFVYSSVIRTVLWPAIFDVSMLDPPTSCLHVMLARRKECGPRPGKSQPSATAARFRACRTPESHMGRSLPSVRTKTHFSGCALSAAARSEEHTSELQS